MTDETTETGTYTLVVGLPRAVTVDVGALGECRFPAGDHDVRHWHVDHLLGSSAACVVTVVVTRGADVECAVASALGGGPVDGFGASDCSCESHLAFRPSVESLEDVVQQSHREVR